MTSTAGADHGNEMFIENILESRDLLRLFLVSLNIVAKTVGSAMTAFSKKSYLRWCWRTLSGTFIKPKNSEKVTLYFV